MRLSVALFVTAALAVTGCGSGAAERDVDPRPAAKTALTASSGWSYLERMGDASAGKISALVSAPLNGRRVVTAVRNADGNLQLTVWEVQYDGAVKRLGSATAGATTQFQIATLGTTPLKSAGSFVTAARTETGTLKLTVWSVNGQGELDRRGSGETGEIHGEFAVTAFPTLATITQLVVTAVRDSDDNLRLISWWVHPVQGTVMRRADAGAGQVDQISLATYDSYPPDNGRLATAVTTASGKLKVIAWSVYGDGTFKRLGDAEAGPAKDVAASTLSHNRIVTASRDGQNRLELRTWDFDAAGQVKPHAIAHAGQIKALALATQNAARVITAVVDAGYRLKVITWDGADTLERLGDSGAGQTGFVSVSPLGSDWLATPVADATSELKVIAWREHSVSFLRGSWGTDARPSASARARARGEEIVTAFSREHEEEGKDDREVPLTEPAGTLVTRDADGIPTSPMWSQRIEPGVERGGFDPMIAVGHNFVVVTQDHQIGFFDKSMKRLAPNIDSTEFFSTFLAGTRGNGAKNDFSINRHLGLPPKGALAEFSPGAGVHCNPDAPWPASPVCVDELYDMRVHFDPASKRFFMVAGARMQKEVNDQDVAKPENPLVRRYWALAVSRAEDPRKGFYQWISTEAHWFDYPRITVNNGLFLIQTNTEADIRDIPAMGLKPQVYALSVADLIDGKPYPRSHKFFPPEFAPKEYSDHLMPLHQFGDDGGRTFFLRPEGKTLYVWSIKRTSNWEHFPLFIKTWVTLPMKVGGPAHVGVLRDGKIYLTWHTAIVDAVPNGKNARRSIWLIRVPLKKLSTTPVASIKESDGYFRRLFGKNAPEDDPSDLVSYEKPDLAVTKDGHMVVLFGRVGFKTKKTLYPEARYSVYYADNRELARSRLLHEGEYMPMEVKKDQTESTIQAPADRLDYQTAVVDPSDDRTVWIISEYADKADADESKDRYRTVVGKLKP